MNDCWETLGIAPTCELKRIKHAYRVLMKRHHPDGAQGAACAHAAAARCAAITEAYRQALAWAEAGVAAAGHGPGHGAGAAQKGYAETHAGIEMQMVWVPAGSATVRIPGADEPAEMRVDIGGFWLGGCQVTQRQYEAVMGENPSRFRGQANPVDSVGWNKAMEFCRRLSAATGRQYTLPTEAQWEHACRAGSQARFCFGEYDPRAMDEHSWHYFNSRKGLLWFGRHCTHPVATKRPNAWGLYDMHGNVWEWCLNIYGSDDLRALLDTIYYESKRRVLRGGCYASLPRECSASHRHFDWQGDTSLAFNGFRAARNP